MLYFPPLTYPLENKFFSRNKVLLLTVKTVTLDVRNVIFGLEEGQAGTIVPAYLFCIHVGGPWGDEFVVLGTTGSLSVSTWNGCSTRARRGVDD